MDSPATPGPVAEQGGEGDDEPFGAEAVAARSPHHQRRGPADEAFDRFAQLGAPGGEGVDDGVALSGQPALDHSGGFKVTITVLRSAAETATPHLRDHRNRP